MTDINTLLTNFFVNTGDIVQAANDPSAQDVEITSATLPATETGNLATHLIDGANYFAAIKGEIATLLAGGTDRFFYTTSWLLGTSPTPGMVPIGEGTFTSGWRANASNPHCGFTKEIAFQLEDNSAGPFHPFQDDIKAMADAGVDVRILVWASPFLVNFKQAAYIAGCYSLQYWAVNVHSICSVLDLRKLHNMENKLVLNTLGHPLSAMHLKMVICGDSTGFRAYVGGIDFSQVRNAEPIHRLRKDKHFNGWHDVVIKVEGPGANGVYHGFEQLWNEQVQRSPSKFKAFGEDVPSHIDGTPLVNPRQTAAINGGKVHTQVLRTLPTMNFSFFGTDRAPISCLKRIVAGFKQKKLSFAEDGIFEFRAAQRKAINAAQQYIYIEDQAMENVELARWINNRMHEETNLKVILLFGGDPLDVPPPDLPEMMNILTDSIAAPEERIVFAKAPYIVHAKLTIIDDVWASIGSSNCWVRSFYMDGEINVSVLDEANPSFAALLRKDLWGEHCGKEPGADCDPLLELDHALGIWRDSWGTPPNGFHLRDSFNVETQKYAKEPPSYRVVLKTVPFVFERCPSVQPDGTLPPCPALDQHPEAMRGVDAQDPTPQPPTQNEREQNDGADSRLEY